MPDPIDVKLASLMLTAAAAVRAKYDALGPQSYERRQEPIIYSENAEGWPSTVTGSFGKEKPVTPLDWRSIASSAKGNYYKLSAEDVPELQVLIDYVAREPDVRKRVAHLANDVADETAEKMIAFDTVRLLTGIMNRAEALKDTSDACFGSLYLEVERGLLAPTLSGDLLFPIALRRLNVDSIVQVADNISIEPLTTELQRARATSGGGSSDVNPYLVAAATHMIVVRAVSLDNSEGALRRQIRLHYAPPGLETADHVCEALSIASGLSVGYAQVCFRPADWADDWRLDLPPLVRLATVQKYPVTLDDRGWLKQHDPIGGDALSKLPAYYAALSKTNRRAQLASRRLAQSTRRELSDDIIIDACIGIEALLGEQKDELSHRMGLRAATALSVVGWKPNFAYDLLKKVYGHRSKIVHGDVPATPNITIDGQTFTAKAGAVFLLSRLLDAHLRSDPPWSPQSLDLELFDQLAKRDAQHEVADEASPSADSG